MSWPAGHGRRTWVSMSLTGWLLAWLILAPVVAAWLVLKAAMALAWLIAWLIRRAHDAPAVPGPLRTPPPRGPENRSRTTGPA